MSMKSATKKSANKQQNKKGQKARPQEQAATTPKAAEKGTAGKGGKKREKQDQPKRVSALDAAAKVLEAEGKPMGCKDLIAAMAAQGLWTSPAGKTPGATLYSAILREIGTKGKDARFKKVDRGQFAFNR